MKILIAVLTILIASILGLYVSMSGSKNINSNADMLQLGDFALEEQRYDDAFTWYQNAANQDLSEGKYQLAKLYESGKGTDKNDKLAAHWMEYAALQGSTKAEYEFGVMLEFGRGIEKATPSAVVDWIEKAAQKGHVEAMVKMAQFLSQGYGLQRDERSALEWALKAKAAGAKNAELLIGDIVAEITKKATNGNAQSQYLLGQMFIDGQGVAADASQAMLWIEKSAQLGYAQAQLSLATHLMAKGEKQSAITWAKRSAEQGLTAAGYAYAAMLATNTAIEPSDAKQVWRWLYHGAQRQDTKTLYNLATCLMNQRLNLPSNDVDIENWLNTSAQAGIIPAQNDLGIYLLLQKNDVRNATIWLKNAATSDASAQFNLGLIYARGQSLAPDYEQAMYWFKLSEKNGGTQANLMLGMMNHLGKGVSRSEIDALNWYKKAASLGDTTAMYNAAMIYYQGVTMQPNFDEAAKNLAPLAQRDDVIAQNIYGSILINRDLNIYNPDEGMMWLLRSARAGYVQAMFNVATINRSGNGVGQDDKKAFYWYQKSAEQNFAPAQNALGYMYAEGRGTKQDTDLAKLWFQKASDNGLAIATNNLKSLKPNASFSLIKLQIDTSLRTEILTDKDYDISSLLQSHQQPIF